MGYEYLTIKFSFRIFGCIFVIQKLDQNCTLVHWFESCTRYILQLPHSRPAQPYPQNLYGKAIQLLDTKLSGIKFKSSIRMSCFGVSGNQVTPALLKISIILIQFWYWYWYLILGLLVFGIACSSVSIGESSLIFAFL